MTDLFFLVIVGDFCEICNFQNLIKVKNCFKNPLKHFCIDLITTNRPKGFQNYVAVEPGYQIFIK